MEENKKKRYHYEEAVAYLLDIPKFAAKTTRENLLGVLEKLGNPHLKRKAIHVAGTNGKGSTCSYLDSILRAAGFHTGLFTSPHLVYLEERFRIDGQVVERQVFEQCFEQFQKAMIKHMEEGNPHVSFFEAIFIVGTLIFEQYSLDYVIYETGMGGRLDATNVLNPVLTIITSIGRDHMQYLGNSIEEIAEEKAGIIKEGVPLVYLAENAGFKVLEQKAVEKGVKQIKISKQNLKIKKKDHKYIDFCMENRYSRDDSLRILTCASYQVENAALAICGAKELYKGLTEDKIKEGLLQMNWSCRMEEVMTGVYLDGAHNEPAIQRFMETVEELDYAEKGLLFAVVKDKDYAKMIEILTKTQRFDYVIITTVQGERASKAEEIVTLFKQNGQKQITLTNTAKMALYKALQWKKEEKDRALFCVGSLYLVGELQNMIKNEDKESKND